jgi:hypothetical protein
MYYADMQVVVFVKKILFWRISSLYVKMAGKMISGRTYLT